MVAGDESSGEGADDRSKPLERMATTTRFQIQQRRAAACLHQLIHHLQLRHRFWPIATVTNDAVDPDPTPPASRPFVGDHNRSVAVRPRPEHCPSTHHAHAPSQASAIPLLHPPQQHASLDRIRPPSSIFPNPSTNPPKPTADQSAITI
ncbi:hypothetical protein ACLOJK_015132 [Asimina triloba]